MLAVQERLTEWLDAAFPVPVVVSVVEDGCALLVNVSVALAAPVVCGLNVTVNGKLCPAGIVAGNGNPLMVKALLFELAPVTVTLAPVAFRWPDAVPLDPTTTPPTGSVLGEAPSCPTVVTPVAESDTTRLEFEAVDVIVKLPVAVPVALGLNVTLKPTDCPAASVIGVDTGLKLNPFPLTAT